MRSISEYFDSVVLARTCWICDDSSHQNPLELWNTVFARTEGFCNSAEVLARTRGIRDVESLSEPWDSVLILELMGSLISKRCQNSGTL